MNIALNSMAHSHPARLLPPYFTPGGKPGGAQLHRYFEPEFINRFEQALQRHELASLADWQQEDAFSGFDNKPVLRLPMHKSFYLVSCELVCDRPGKPALDPAQISSAGFVIRRQGTAGEQSWMLEDDQALGWQSTPTGPRDPDLNRRLCQVQGMRPKVRLRGAPTPPPATTYTGEQTHPLHAIKHVDAEGKYHTILYGYLPLGGSYVVRQPVGKSISAADTFSAESLGHFNNALAAQLLWPFGFKSGSQAWTAACTRPINQGYPSAGLFELLKVLVNRYHLGEPKRPDNAALEAWAGRQYFYQEALNPHLNPAVFNDYSRASFLNARRFSLLVWLRQMFANTNAPLVSYLASQEAPLNRDGSGGGLKASPTRLPGVSDYALYITPADAQELRALLNQRALAMATGKVKEIPLPKFGQAREDVYEIVPFVRLRTACGGEEIVWGATQVRSQPFRVAAPFDPNASRPSLIQMPSLADLRKGMAQGVSMITPSDTFSLLNALNLKKGVSEDLVPNPNNAPQLGIQWICSFSLPVITLVAMILLMIMISLLNIIFFWLPWVRICLPFPSIKKE